MACCVTECLWTVLAEVMCPDNVTEGSWSMFGAAAEAAAANEAWKLLMRQSVQVPELTPNSREALQSVFDYAIRCFTDLLLQIESMESEPSLSTYAWETMSESLVGSCNSRSQLVLTCLSQKLASICCIALQALEKELIESLEHLMSENCPLSDYLVHESAFKSITVLVQKSVMSPCISLCC